MPVLDASVSTVTVGANGANSRSEHHGDAASAEHHLIIQSRCVARALNWRADLLSKHQAQRFLDRTPAARPSGTTPRSVPTLLSQPQSRPP